MRVLPEQVLVRRAVGLGIGRVVRELYAHHPSQPLPDHIRELLARVDPAKASADKRSPSSGPTSKYRTRLD